MMRIRWLVARVARALAVWMLIGGLQAAPAKAQATTFFACY